MYLNLYLMIHFYVSLRYGAIFTDEHILAGRKYLSDLQALLNVNHLTIIKFLKLMRPCDDYFESCWWDGVKKNCSELFKFSYTYAGVCCSFNYLLQDDIQTGRYNYICLPTQIEFVSLAYSFVLNRIS